MNSKNQQKKKEIDWMITLVPLALIVALCIVFFFAPEQSNQVLGQIRFLFGDTFGTYYLVIVPDDQLSLAIGKEGQNARLAAKLTGCKIDIAPESQGE